MEALNRWLASRSQLERAASDFLNACGTLRTEIFQALASPVNRFILDDAFSQFESQMDVIGSVENYMHRSRSTLNSLLNLSPSLVPINQLPPEILGRIFTLALSASPDCPGHPDSEPDALRSISLVCTCWHDVALKVPALWSHLEISPIYPIHSSNTAHIFDRMRLWLNRSRGAPFHVYVTGDLRSGEADEQLAFAVQLGIILQPYSSSLGSLTIHNSDGYHLIKHLISLYSANGIPGTLKNLSLSNIMANDRTGALNWPVRLLQGLAELHLESLGGLITPSSDVIAAMLSSSPALHTLRLYNLWISSDYMRNHPMIHLPCLKLLRLMGLSGQGLPLLLSALAPGMLELDVRLDFNHDMNAQVILERGKVVSLTVCNSGHGRSGHILRSYLSASPTLRALLVESLPFMDSSWIFSELVSACDSGLKLPQLQSLCVTNAGIDKVYLIGLNTFTKTRGLRHLIFTSCNFLASSVEMMDAENYEDDEDDEYSTDSTDEDDRSLAQNHDCGIPDSVRKWFSGWVGSVSVVDSRLGLVYRGVDSFVQGLTKID
ncbi:hypothetical protein FRC12_024260 [Ceratobasidium sp. 428]|nr:hypothetical protein FRC12_024260 [Ceratobasidium sp. 428]